MNWHDFHIVETSRNKHWGMKWLKYITKHHRMNIGLQYIRNTSEYILKLQSHQQPHVWNYFETGHGKGEHDGAPLRRGEMKFTGARLRDVESIVQWCASVMGEQATRKHLVWIIFWEVTNVDRSQTPWVNTVHGTRRFHSIRSSDNLSLQIWTRLKSCFCNSHSIDEWDDCQYTNTIDTWDRVRLGTDYKGFN